MKPQDIGRHKEVRQAIKKEIERELQSLSKGKFFVVNKVVVDTNKKYSDVVITVTVSDSSIKHVEMAAESLAKALSNPKLKFNRTPVTIGRDPVDETKLIINLVLSFETSAFLTEDVLPIFREALRKMFDELLIRRIHLKSA